MLTMATSHGLAVLTNSCVKPPLDSKTGLPTTVHERGASSFSHTWDEKPHESESEPEDDIKNATWKRDTGYRTQASPRVDLTATDPLIESLTNDLSNLSDEDFYRKLQELKSEHKKTLSLCKSLYDEKLQAESFEHVTGKPPYEITGRYHTRPDGSRYSDEINAVPPSVHKVFQGDNVRDMSSKPPAPPTRPKTSHGRMSMSHSSSLKKAWADEDKNLNDRFLNSNTNENKSFQRQNQPNLPVANDSSMSQIEDMWENFSVEDYAPRERTNSMSSGISSTSSRQKVESSGKEWRHRITIPKPFKMMLRDNEKPKKKTSAMIALENEIEEKKRKEEEECQKKFKAQPAPAHIYVPLFDEIMEEKETRRRAIKDLSSEIVNSMIQPFKFSIREEEKKRQRSQSIPNIPVKKEKSKFKARPIPKEVFDESIMEKIAEEEEYRKIRIKMRAEEMLRSASLPRNMESRNKALAQTRSKVWSSKAKELGLSTSQSFKPKINPDVPNFEEKHWELQRELSKRKLEKDATVCKPFNLRTSRIPSKKNKVYEDMQKDEETLKENRWPYKNPRAKPEPVRLSRGALSASMDTIPAKMTASSELRSSANKEKMSTMIKKELEELENERRRRQRERQLKKMVAERAAANDRSVPLKACSKEKLKGYKEADRARQEEYRREMNEIKERVDKRPFLFERTTQVNARKAAERKYHDTLRRAGIDEEFIADKGSHARGYRYEDDDDDDDDASDLGSYRATVKQGYEDDGLSDGDRTPEEQSDLE